MAKCKYCSRKGLFLFVDGNGLCPNCQSEHLPHIVENALLLEETLKGYERLSTAKAKLNRIATGRKACSKLLPFERNGIQIASMPLSAVLTEFSKEEKLIVDAEISDALYLAEEKSADANSHSAKLTPFSRSVERLFKLMDQAEDVSSIELAIQQLRQRRDQVRVESYKRTADVWAAKGKPKKAIDVLSEALVELRHDTTPDDLQSDTINDLTLRIEQLRDEI